MPLSSREPEQVEPNFFVAFIAASFTRGSAESPRGSCSSRPSITRRSSISTSVAPWEASICRKYGYSPVAFAIL